MNGVGSWQAWARSVASMTPAMRLVLIELARLADGVGVTYTSTAQIVEGTGLSRRAVIYSLNRLEQQGLLTREHRFGTQGQWANCYRLQREHGQRVSVTPTVTHAQIGEHVGYPLGAADNDALRLSVAQAIAHGWNSPAASTLAATLMEYGKQRFYQAIQRQVALCGVTREDATDYILSYAWDVLTSRAQAIRDAQSPWSYWTQWVTFAPLMRDVKHVDFFATDTLPDAPLVDESTTGNVEVGYDDFQGVLYRVAHALIEAGLKESEAYAGTLRVVEIAQNLPFSLRHTIAGSDAFLAQIGVSPKGAREWMTLVTGTKRHKTGSALELSDAELKMAAQSIVATIGLLNYLTA